MAPSIQAADPLKAYPKADKGMTRHVLHLKPEKDESILKIELVLGKTVKIDAVNRYFFAGNIESKTVEGWGYPYYHLPKVGPMAGTLMAIPPGTPKKKRFIAIGGEPYLIQYHSKFPIVVYAPEGVEVRYRLWRGDSETSQIDEK